MDARVDHRRRGVCAQRPAGHLAANPLGHALYSEMYDGQDPPVNSARFVFLDRRSKNFYLDWQRAASDVVAILRSEAGCDPPDRSLSDLVGELSTRSDEFRTLWAAHNVKFHNAGVKEVHHPVVGDLRLSYDRMLLAADSGLAITTWTAEPDSTSAESLSLLASWAVTHDPTETARATDC